MLRPKFYALTLLGLIISFSVFGQDSLRRAVSQQLRANDYATAVKTYEVLFNEYGGNSFDYYNAACSWSLLRNSQKSLQYLDSAFIYGYTNLNKAKTDPDLTLIRRSPRFQELIDREEAFYAEENIDYLWILEALTKRPVVLLTNKNHYNSVGHWLDFNGIPLKKILDSRPDLDFKITEDSLIDFSDRTLIIQNGKGKIHLERLKLKRLVIANSPNNLASRVQFDNLIALHDLDLAEISWQLINYDMIRLYRVNAEAIGSYYMDKLREVDITDSKLKLTREFTEPGGGPAHYQFGENSAPIEQIRLTRNEFRIEEGKVGRIPLYIYAVNFAMAGNTFYDEVDFSNSQANIVNISDNLFLRAVNLDGSNFHNPTNYLPYYQFEGGFGVEGSGGRTWEQWQERTLVIGNEVGISQPQSYDKLVYNYKLMHTNYKTRGEMVSANAAYIDLKDLMLKHDYLKFEETGSFESLLQYQIGRLLKFYTRSGTSPARAIVVSFFIILLFSIIYLLFPSEWDTKSKKRMIEDYRIFREKNERGYVKPFFIMVAGLVRSWLNAFALSLNAFVTLGFGAIPTKGVGRYICIIQGFMGWFLLSIFTVSLINQVLI